jgi:hypothetical protein
MLGEMFVKAMGKRIFLNPSIRTSFKDDSAVMFVDAGVCRLEMVPTTLRKPNSRLVQKEGLRDIRTVSQENQPWFDSHSTIFSDGRTSVGFSENGQTELQRAAKG